MNLRTLIEIVRPDLVNQYDDRFEDLGELDENLALKYEVLENDLVAEGGTTYLNGLESFHIIRNKDTGKYYRISYTHDSWSDNPIEAMSYRVDIKLVSPEEVKVIQYKEIVRMNLEDL